MPDIMMCGAVNCPKSATCYRHADSGTTPSEWRQSYWMRGPADPVGDECQNYWQISCSRRATGGIS